MFGYYINELRSRGWSKALCVVPHDAAQTHADNPTGIDFEAQLRAAQFETKKLHSPPGIVMQRIATARRYFPRMWFNRATTQPLRDALQAYAEKKHEKTGEGLGPNHDWASHFGDAFGAMAIDYEGPGTTVKKLDIPSFGAV